jgi:transposase-like protein
MANGRDRDKGLEAQWRRIVRQHARSGLSVREFCGKCKLRQTAFYFWRGELRRRQAEQEQRRSADSPSAPAFVPVRVQEHSGTVAGGRIEIELPGGRRVHVTAPVDRAVLADVLAVLEGLPSAALAQEGQPC